MIKLIVALGNNEKQYFNTRHNVAQSFITYSYNPNFVDKLSSKYSPLLINNNKYHLIYPNTLMNNSGKSVSRISSFFNIDSDQILVISDDLENDFGTVEIKKGGSAKGHNGLKNIHLLLKSTDIINLKIGIGRPKFNDVTNHVLSPFSSDEKIALPLVFDLAKNMLETYLLDEKNCKRKLP